MATYPRAQNNFCTVAAHLSPLNKLILSTLMACYELSKNVEIMARNSKTKISPRTSMPQQLSVPNDTLLLKKNCSSNLDFLQSAFSLKFRLVLISASAIANHDVMLQ